MKSVAEFEKKNKQTQQNDQNDVAVVLCTTGVGPVEIFTGRNYVVV